LKTVSGLNPATFGRILLSDYKGTGVPATIPNYFLVFFKAFLALVFFEINEDKNNKHVKILRSIINF
jgi:hypothetical protein